MVALAAILNLSIEDYTLSFRVLGFPHPGPSWVSHSLGMKGLQPGACLRHSRSQLQCGRVGIFGSGVLAPAFQRSPKPEARDR